MALALLIPAIGLEAGVRVLIAAGRLPEAPAHFRDFEISWENLDRLGRADILILGDSVTQQGIDPALLADHVAEVLSRPVSAFNMATASGTFGINAALVAELARQDRLPRVAIIGIQPGAVRTDAFYSDSFAPSPLGGLLTGCRESRNLAEGVDCRLSLVSAAWRWRGQLDRLWGSLFAGMPTGSLHAGKELRADGFRAGTGSDAERLSGQLRQMLRRTPDGLEVDPAVQASYQDLVRTLRDNGVAVIPVAVPESPPFVRRLEMRNPRWEAERHAAVAVLDAASGIESVYVARFGDWWRPASASSLKHLSQRGAEQFVDQLWAMPEFRDRLLEGLEGVNGSAGGT